MPSMPGMGRHEIQLSQKIAMSGMPAMETKFVPTLSKRRLILAQATLGGGRCQSAQPKRTISRAFQFLLYAALDV